LSIRPFVPPSIQGKEREEEEDSWRRQHVRTQSLASVISAKSIQTFGGEIVSMEQYTHQDPQPVVLPCCFPRFCASSSSAGPDLRQQKKKTQATKQQQLLQTVLYQQRRRRTDDDAPVDLFFCLQWSCRNNSIATQVGIGISSVSLEL
jgi:hypothetical protein